MNKPASNAPDIDHVLYDLMVLGELHLMTATTLKQRAAIDGVMKRLNDRATAIKEDHAARAANSE